MVWAVSHDTADAKFSNALGSFATRSFKSLIQDKSSQGGVTSYQETTNYGQCKWTNCAESKSAVHQRCQWCDPCQSCLTILCYKTACPSGYSPQLRSDEDARTGEYMLNNQGCEGDQSRALCCPAHDPLPLCGWYGHNNGNCNPSCPADAAEVGSNNLYCHKLGRLGNKLHQVACCSQVTRWRDGAMKAQENMRLAS
jgi:hypothetical protein